MLAGGNKFQKTVKTKYRKNNEQEPLKSQKKRHHDKSYYRLAKEEREEYGYVLTQR
jgi:hypothetical protein